MKKYKILTRKKIILLIILFSLLSNLISCNAETNSNKSNLVYKENVSQAKVILNKYLDARQSEHFKTCVTFLSSEFKNNFSKTYNISFSDHLKSNETYYRSREIIEYESSDASIIVFTVSVVIEDPGVRSETEEWYYLIQGNGQWQINDIRYSEKFKIIEKIQPNGSWEKVNTL